MKKQSGEFLGQTADAVSLYFETLKSESERGKIILLASKIDELLSELLKNFFKPKRGEKKDPDKLFRDMGPLSSFSARIEMAYRMGLISKVSADCFDILRSIRNDCAHSMKPFTYWKGKHGEKFQNFKDLSYTISGMRKFLELVERIEIADGNPSKDGLFFMLTIVHILSLQSTLRNLAMVGDSFISLENVNVWPTLSSLKSINAEEIGGG
jgi:hypothetical protein